MSISTKFKKRTAGSVGGVAPVAGNSSSGIASLTCFALPSVRNIFYHARHVSQTAARRCRRAFTQLLDGPGNHHFLNPDTLDLAQKRGPGVSGRNAEVRRLPA